MPLRYAEMISLSKVMAAAALAFAAWTVMPAAAEPFRFANDAMSGQLVVKFHPGTPSSLVIGTFNINEFVGAQARLLDPMPRIDGIVIGVPAAERGTGVTSATLSKLRANPAVQYAEPNYIYYADRAPTDPLVKDMWFLKTISAFEAWEQSTESPEVVVAVIDTGIFMNHEDLRGHIWTNAKEIPDNGVDDDKNGYVDDIHGWNFAQGHSNPTAELVFGAGPGCAPDGAKRAYEFHGTHVAGTIGALGENGKGIVGISRKVRIMPIKALGGPCGSGLTSSLIQAVAYAVENGAHVINMSLGGGQNSIILREQLKAASQKGVLVVAAAGNEANNNDAKPSYPASYDIPGIISVAASGQNDALAAFSNYGSRSVHLAAPGVGILSSVPLGASPEGPKSGYGRLDGTSMAAPVVSGAVALLVAQFPRMARIDIKRRLLESVDPIEALRGKVASGGRLNLRRALGTAFISSPTKPAPTRPAPVRDIGGIKIGPPVDGASAPSGPHTPSSGGLTGKDLK
jgi:subtilisin family serine protease